MGREDTFKGKETAFDDMFDSTVNIKDGGSFNAGSSKPASTSGSTPVSSKKEEPKKKSEPTTKSNANNNITKKIDFSKKKQPDSKTRSIRLPQDIDDAMIAVVTRNGKKIKGSKGFIKALMTNGVIKEMVELGILDESYLNRLTDYDEFG